MYLFKVWISKNNKGWQVIFYFKLVILSYKLILKLMKNLTSSRYKFIKKLNVWAKKLYKNKLLIKYVTTIFSKLVYYLGVVFLNMVYIFFITVEWWAKHTKMFIIYDKLYKIQLL